MSAAATFPAVGDKVQIVKERKSSNGKREWKQFYGGYHGTVVRISGKKQFSILVCMESGPLEGENRWFTAEELEPMEQPV